MTTNSEPRLISANGARRLLAFLAERRESLSPLLILTHDYPDPDALASAFALQYLAQTSFGIQSRIVYGGEIGRTENRVMAKRLRIPAHRLPPGLLKRSRNVALVDTQPDFDNNPFPRGRRATLVIDQHHSMVPVDAELAIVDPECGATCAIVAQALLEQGTELTERVATALAYGILTDTQDFYRARRSDVIQTYLRILPHADMGDLALIQNPARTRRFFSTVAKGIREAALYGHLLVTHLGAVEAPDLVSQVAEFLVAYRRADWCLATGRFKGRLHASLRTSRNDAPAGAILRDAFDDPRQAGGHGAIAGGSCPLNPAADEAVWQAAERRLQERLRKRLRIAAKATPRKPFEI
jgi:nanoRNase/pAp phosphatase (c-di-AMP/oligoRNAs hydrolase)